MSAEHALLAAMRTALLADAALVPLVDTRIYDDPPTDVVFPYVTLGRIETRATDASAAAALDHVVTLHVWSRHAGGRKRLASSQRYVMSCITRRWRLRAIA